MELSKASVCVATTNRLDRFGRRQGFTAANLMAEYLLKNAKSSLIIDQPISSDPDLRPWATYRSHTVNKTKSGWKYEGREEIREQFGHAPRRLLKLFDFFSVLWFVSNGRYDIFMAGEMVNFLAGYILKKLRRVRTLVYIPGDVWLWKPKGKIFHLLDRFAAAHADFTLNTTLMDARMRDGQTKKPQLVIPCLCPHEIDRSKFDNHRSPEGHQFVYLGALEKRFGIDTIILAVAGVRKRIPDVIFHIIGRGADRQRLEKMADFLIDDPSTIVFHGFLSNDDAGKIIEDCIFGVAPYAPGEFTAKLDSGKIRFYALNGLPSLVTSEATESVQLVQRYGAGMPFKPTPDDFASVATRFLLKTDEKERQRFATGCLSLVEDHDSEKYFPKLFEQILQK